MWSLVIIHVSPRRLCNKWMWTDDWKYASNALKRDSGLYSCSDCVLNINKTTKGKEKITLCSWLKDIYQNNPDYDFFHNRAALSHLNDSSHNLCSFVFLYIYSVRVIQTEPPFMQNTQAA